MTEFEAAIRALIARLQKALSEFPDWPHVTLQSTSAVVEGLPIPDRNGEPTRDETLPHVASPAVDVGTEPAKCVQEPVQDLVRTDLDRTYVRTQGAGVPEGEGAAKSLQDFAPAAEPVGNFTLTEAAPKPRAEKFNPILFAEFWTAYPRKVGRLAAIKAFTRIEPSRALVDTMIAAVEAQGRTDEWRRGFIPHASTWLNGARWEDELDAPGRHVAQSTWRDRCPHDPTCGTPTRCMSLQAREEVTT